MDCSSENNSLVDPSSSDNSVIICLNEKSYNKLQQHSEAKLNSQPWTNTKSNIRIDFEDLIYSVSTVRRGRREKDILHKISGCFRPLSLIAIIGPSGSGKSSLLSTICGMNLLNVRGNIHINGVYVKPDTLRKIVCFIPQEFALLPWLTTEETLYFAARLKIASTDNESFKDIVKEVANKLGLLEAFHTMAKNLSGGEKKRLAIAVEIVVKPLVLVLDEPTSGLDSMASIQVISLLHNMAKNGCTIACSIHQPNSKMMTMFDDVLVIAEGREIYCGPTSSIVDTFKQAGFICPSFYNVGEFVIDVATGQIPGDVDALRKLSKQSLMCSLNHSNLDDAGNNVQKLDDEKNFLALKKNYFNQRSIKWVTELQILLWRAVICVRRNWTMTQLRLAAHVVIGVLLGLVFRNFGDEGSKTFSNIACLFFFLLFLFFANAMPAVQMFPVEAVVLVREHSNSWYNLGSYYIAKLITDLPLQILCPTVFLMIAYSLTGQPLETNRFMKVWIICFLLSILAQAFGILTGAAFNVHIGCFLIPSLNIPMFLFAGFFLKLNEIPSYLHIIRKISFFRYAFEGILQAIYGNERKTLKCSVQFCILRSPKFILSHMDMPSTTFTIIIVALLTWIICLHTFIYIILRWKLVRIK